MPKNKNKNTSSSHQISQDMLNNLIHANFPTPNPNTHSPSGSSSAQSNSQSLSQPTGFANFVPLSTNPYSQSFYQQHPQQAFYPFPQQQNSSQPQQQQYPQPYYTNLLHQHSSNPYQQMQTEIQDSSDDTTEKTHVDESVPETQPEPETQTKPKPKPTTGEKESKFGGPKKKRVFCANGGYIVPKMVSSAETKPLKAFGKKSFVTIMHAWPKNVIIVN